MNLQKNPIFFRLRKAIALFALTLLSGTFGYMYILDLNVVDSIYFTVVTLTTVGYGEIVPMGPPAKMFTVVFLLGGIITASYTASILLAALIEGEVQGVVGHRRMIRRIKRMRDHAIICGFGRIGRDLAKNLTAEGLPFVVIEQSEEAVGRAEEAGYEVLRGDATIDALLEEAGVEKAKSILPVLASDADNLYIVISARQLNPRINIVARATDEAAEKKMKRAGADRVMRPLHIGAQHLAQAVIRPTVLDFIQISGRSPDESYALEEIAITSGSALVGHTLADVGTSLLQGIIVVGIKRVGGDLIFNPRGATELNAGDTLVAMGATADMGRLAEASG